MDNIYRLFQKNGGWKVLPKLHGDPRYAAYVKAMADELKKKTTFVKPVKPKGMSDEEFTLSLQEESTKEILHRQKDPDYKRDWTEDLPANMAFDHVNERPLTVDEHTNYKRMQRASKNTLGQSIDGASKERRESAVDHFLSHPGILEAHLSDDELAGIKGLEMKPQSVVAAFPREEWKPMPWYKALAHWLRGNKVKLD